MLRAAAWTCGLFAVGGGVVHFFPGPVVEPVVLLALGMTLFLLSGRKPGQARDSEAPASDDAVDGTRVAR